MASIVTIGGGTGQFMLLSGLKTHPVELTAIVSMADDGGSTGMLRDEQGVLPPGDVRQCLVALSESEQIMRDLFNHRFPQEGGLRGHNSGNLLLSALEQITGSFEEAVRVVSRDILKVRGTVVPVTTDNVELVYESDPAIVGEDAIQHAVITDPALLRLAPAARANPRAIEAIAAADMIAIGPGNLYCSIVPTLLVEGVAAAIAASKAMVVYNCNLMTKRGHTDGFTVGRFLREIERHLGRGRIDRVTYNAIPPPAELVERYANEGEPVIMDHDEFDGLHATAVGGRLVSDAVPVARPGDAIKRTFIRHDHELLAATIVSMLGGRPPGSRLPPG